MNDLTAKVIGAIHNICIDHRWKSQLNECERNIAQTVKPLSVEQKREIKEYYSRHGFNSINTRWHQYIYSVTGQFFPTFLPEDFFHRVLENTYNSRSFYTAWEDKVFMPFILDTVRFPETICCNVNGLFYDGKRQAISIQEA